MTDPHTLSQIDPDYRRRGYVFIGIAIFFGVGDTIILKVIGSTKTLGVNFNYPILMAFIANLGMFFALFLEFLCRCFIKKDPITWKKYYIFAIASLLDVVSLILFIQVIN